MNFEFPMKRIRSRQNSLHSNLLGNLIILSIFKIRVKERGDICSKKQTKFIGISFRKFNLRLHTRIEKKLLSLYAKNWTGKNVSIVLIKVIKSMSKRYWIERRGGKKRIRSQSNVMCFLPFFFFFFFSFSKLASKETQFLVRSYRQQVFIPRGKLNGRVINLPCLINRGSEGNIIIGELILSLSDGKTVFDN